MHETRLNNLEATLRESLEVINSNIDILTEGYNSIAGRVQEVENGYAHLRSMGARLDELEERIAAKSTESAASDQSEDPSFPAISMEVNEPAS